MMSHKSHMLKPTSDDVNKAQEALSVLRGQGAAHTQLMIQSDDGNLQPLILPDGFGELLENMLAVFADERAILVFPDGVDWFYDQSVELLHHRIHSKFRQVGTELRTPINSVIGFSKILLEGLDGELNEAQKEDVEIIHRSGQYLLSIINDVVDEYRIANHMMDATCQYFDIVSVVEAVKTYSEKRASHQSIMFKLDIADNLPKAYADQSHIGRVLFSIVDIALMFAEPDQIKIRASLQGDKIHIAVSDTGKGIPPKQIPHVFDMFDPQDLYKTRVHRGSGLGLPIAKALIEQNGGDILVESIEGVETTFTVIIPTQPIMPAHGQG